MPSERRWLSALLAFHLTAITVAALPPPGDFGGMVSVRQSGKSDFRSRLTTTLDRLASQTWAIAPQLYRLLAPVRALTQPYVSAGLKQNWNMFANPRHEDSYVRLDYFIAPSGSRLPDEHVQQLVAPAAPENQLRWRYDFTDKAIFNAIENHFMRLEVASDVRQPLVASSDLVPIAHHFARRFTRTLPSGRQVVRVELWYGTAPIPPPGEHTDLAQLNSRRQQLDSYRQRGQQRVRAAPVQMRPTESVREAGVKWNLLYSDEP